MESHIPLDSLSINSPTTAIAYAFLVIYGVHLALVYFDVPILSLQELLWNAVVYCIPAPLLLDPTRRRELRTNGMLPQMQAAKSDALRQILGFRGNAILQQMPSAGEALVGSRGSRWSSMYASGSVGATSEAPAGLGNWDNSCYQNSVLQALSAIDTLPAWLRSSQEQIEHQAGTTKSALHETIGKLRDPTNNGRHLWTPAKLKNMSSWQQQDAQEYFSKMMEELDKEVAKDLKSKAVKPGLESLLHTPDESSDQAHGTKDVIEKQEAVLRNPLEGLIAQRVACTSCGFSEGYAMIPFNCLTVPLGSSMEYDLAECLDEYTKQEAIEGVECRRCTLLRAETRIKAMAATRPHHSNSTTADTDFKVLDLPPEVRAQIAQRLHAIQTALSEDDYSDKTLKHDCQIPGKSYSSSTKTREALIGRTPQTLVVHVNRSVFDEMTGTQRKNYAHVRYPLSLDLTPWILGDGNPTSRYHLRAVVTHYGRHENGHYICYRQHRPIDAESKDVMSPQWWRLSDEDVSSATEDDVLNQGGVFMLFYEREPDYPLPTTFFNDSPEAAVVPSAGAVVPTPRVVDVDDGTLPAQPVEAPAMVPSLSQSVTSESDNDVEHEREPSSKLATNRRQQAPIMRTAPPTNVRHEVPLSRSLMSV